LAFFPEQFRISAAVEDKFRGTEVSIPAPCRDEEVPPEPSPLVSIAVSAVSIDLTAISINLAISYDEEAVVLPLIRLKRIYNFLCSMLVFTPFALCFATLRGVFMRFPELTY
jgi:hypothetical protein